MIRTVRLVFAGATGLVVFAALIPTWPFFMLYVFGLIFTGRDGDVENQEPYILWVPQRVAEWVAGP